MLINPIIILLANAKEYGKGCGGGARVETSNWRGVLVIVIIISVIVINIFLLSSVLF